MTEKKEMTTAEASALMSMALECAEICFKRADEIEAEAREDGPEAPARAIAVKELRMAGYEIRLFASKKILPLIREHRIATGGVKQL